LLKEAGLVTNQSEGTKRIYTLHTEGVEALRMYVERVWGEADARLKLVTEEPRS
jgi:hypothetical protein